MKLYFSPYSTNSRKVRLAAAQLKLPLELIEVDLSKGAQRKPEFVAVNPMGRVPVLDDDGFVLTESAAIMIYLAEKGRALYPGEPRARANVNRWLFWSASHFEPAIGALTRENVVKAILGLGPPDPAQVQRQTDTLRDLAGVLDAHLSSRSWICESAITLADLAIASHVGVSDRAGFPMQSYGAIQRWFSRIRDMEAWKDTEPPQFPRISGGGARSA